MTLTKAQKRQIDILLPTVLAAIAGIVAFRRKSDYKLMLLVIAGTFIITYVITSQLTRYAYSGGPLPVPDGGAGKDFDGLPLATQLYNDIYSVFAFRNDKPYEQLLALSDGQLTAVYNAWNASFFAKDSETLPVAIAGENSGWGIVGSFADSQAALAARFQRLKLN